MARARNIKPALFKNELLGVADPYITLLFQSLWMLADREGRLEDRPLRIKAETFPYREGLDINGYLTELQRMGFIVRYSVESMGLIQVVNFKKHQTPHNTEKASELPPVEAGTVAGCGFAGGFVNSPLNNREKTEALPPDSLIPDSFNLIPDSRFLIPETREEQPLTPAIASAGKKKAEPKEEVNPLNLLTWQSYRHAYECRYSVPPIRDAATNVKIKSIVRALGVEAPDVAAFFVSHNGSRYVGGMHQIGFLATDYAKLRTEWATNTRMTNTKAQQADKTATNLDAFAPLIAAAKAREEAERNQHAEQ